MGLFNKQQKKVNDELGVPEVTQDEHGVWIIEGTRFREATKEKAELRRSILIKRSRVNV